MQPAEKGLDISECKTRTAEGLIQSLRSGDRYHDAIRAAAAQLVALGYGDASYKTSWISGTTVWQLPGGDSVTISSTTTGEPRNV